MKQKLQRLTRSPWFPFWLVCSGIFLFYIFCARLLVKTDDGHFLGILHDSGFTLGDWLRNRYHTVSGRTVSEWLMMSFLRAPFPVWQLASAALLCTLVCFLCKLALACPGRVAARDKITFACTASLLVLPTCMSAGAFWFAGSFTYLWPMAALVVCVMPLAFGVLDAPFPRWLYALSVLAAPIAASEEQAAAATVALLLFLNLCLLLKKRWRVWAALPLVPVLVCAYFLLASPGAQLRNAAEAKSNFPAFLELSAVEKLLCGFSNYAAYAFFLSLPVMAIFLLVLYQNLRGFRRVTLAHGLCGGLLCIGGNLGCLAMKRCVPDQLFERAFKSGEFDAFSILLLAACALFFLFTLALLLLLARKQRAAGLAAGLCFAAAACCGIVPGFSGSVYASGQRIFFFSDLFLLMGAAVLFGSAENSKAMKRIRFCACFFAVGFALVHLLGFKFLELPLMG